MQTLQKNKTSHNGRDSSFQFFKLINVLIKINQFIIQQFVLDLRLNIHCFGNNMFQRVILLYFPNM